MLFSFLLDPVFVGFQEFKPQFQTGGIIPSSGVSQIEQQAESAALTASIREISDQPQFVSVKEFRDVQNRLEVNENQNSL